MERLERGQVRARPSLLATLAAVLDPDDPDGLWVELCAAAGGSLVPDTAASVRRRLRAARRARRARTAAARRWADAREAARVGRWAALDAVDADAMCGTGPVAAAALAAARAGLDQADALAVVERRARARLDWWPRQGRLPDFATGRAMASRAVLAESRIVKNDARMHAGDVTSV